MLSSIISDPITMISDGITIITDPVKLISDPVTKDLITWIFLPFSIMSFLSHCDFRLGLHTSTATSRGTLGVLLEPVQDMSRVASMSAFQAKHGVSFNTNVTDGAVEGQVFTRATFCSPSLLGTMVAVDTKLYSSVGFWQMSHEFQHEFGIVCVPPVKQDICIRHQEHIVLILGTRIQQPAIVFVNFGLPFRFLFLDSFLVLDPVVLE